MNIERKNPGQDKERLVDEAVRAIREVRVPEGPPGEVVESVLTAGNREQDQFTKGRFKMNRLMKIAAAILIVVGVGAVIGLLTQGNGTAGTAWAAVQEQIRNAHTCTYTQTTQVEGMPEVKSKTMITEGGLVRREVIEPEEAVYIMNFQNGRMLILQEKQKIATLSEIPGYSKIGAERYAEHYQGDFSMKMVKAIIEESKTDLGTKQIDGQMAQGYQMDKNGLVSTAWVDIKTGRLLKIEMFLNYRGMKWVYTDYEFDKELDEELFSMKPPAGYTIVERPMNADQPLPGKGTKTSPVLQRSSGTSRKARESIR